MKQHKLPVLPSAIGALVYMAVYGMLPDNHRLEWIRSTIADENGHIVFIGLSEGYWPLLAAVPVFAAVWITSKYLQRRVASEPRPMSPANGLNDRIESVLKNSSSGGASPSTFPQQKLSGGTAQPSAQAANTMKPGLDELADISAAAFALAKQHAKPGVALIRPYPPRNVGRIRSRIGGLPDLPVGVAWPLQTPPDHATGMEDDVPLHFMAQLDLAELPHVHPLMPKSGTLLFFALMDEDMIWSGEKGSVRVIYDGTSSGKAKLPPQGIGPLQGGYHHYGREFRLEEEAAPTVHACWPLIGKVVNTLPGFGAMNVPHLHKSGEAFENQCNADLAAQLLALGEVPSLGRQSLVGSKWIAQDADGNERPSKACVDELLKSPRLIELLIRAVLRALEEAHRGLPYQIERLRQSAAQAASSFETAFAQERLTKASAAQRSIPGALQTGLALQRFFAVMQESQRLSSTETVPVAGWLDVALPSLDRKKFSHVLSVALRQAVVESGGNAELANNLSPDVWAFADWDHRVVLGLVEKPRNEPVFVRFHQMFGHIRTSQGDSVVDDPNICLLQLRSDYGVNLMSCDVGEMEFWIKPEDLRNLNFDNVWGTTQGG